MKLLLPPSLFLLPSALFAQGPTTPGVSSMFTEASGNGLIVRRTAHRKGDVLTIRVREVMKGQYSASTTTAKTVTGAVSASIPLFDVFAGPVLGSILGNQAGIPQKILNSLTKGGTTAGNQSTAGSGNANTVGDFSATLSVLVTDVDANGNLHVEGYRWIRVNKEVQKMTLSGIVRQDDVTPDNSVASEKIANVDLKADGKGAVAEKTRQGILSRILGWLL